MGSAPNAMVAALIAAPTVDLWPTAGQAIGVSRATAYRMAVNGQWPTKLLRVGTRYRVPTAPLLAYLGIEPALADGPSAA